MNTDYDAAKQVADYLNANIESSFHTDMLLHNDMGPAQKRDMN